MIISPFTPLFFKRHKTDGLASEYVQVFAPSDVILLEIIGAPEEEVNAEVINEIDGSTLYNIQFNRWAINEQSVLHFTTMSLSPGEYSVKIEGVGKSEMFRVTDDRRVLENTTLIQYANKNNRQRNDAIFLINGMQYFFAFRVPGGFKDSNWKFSVDNEQFETAFSDISQLYGLESTQKEFTLGTSAGVPICFGEMLNRILVCSHVYFDGVKYCRKDSSVPELNEQLEGVNSFVFTVNLQQSINLDPVIENKNQAILRRIADDYRAVNKSINRLIQ